MEKTKENLKEQELKSKWHQNKLKGELESHKVSLTLVLSATPMDSDRILFMKYLPVSVLKGNQAEAGRSEQETESDTKRDRNGEERLPNDDQAIPGERPRRPQARKYSLTR